VPRKAENPIWWNKGETQFSLKASNTSIYLSTDIYVERNAGLVWERWVEKFIDQLLMMSCTLAQRVMIRWLVLYTKYAVMH